MKSSIQTLGQILYAPSQYVIPVFQRNYRWEEPQWDELWENLMEIQRPDKRGNHFMGFLVFVPELPEPGKNNTFHLVDGQQRLATSSILLAALRNIAKDRGQPDLADEIHQYYLVHPLKRGEQYYRLLPKERDHDNYVSLVTRHGTPAGGMADALKYFEGKLSTDSADSPERLRQVFDTVCQRFEFVCATLETENAYYIFKSLNSTGVPLGSSDLIRNFMFMHLPPGEQDEFDRDLWGPLEDHFAGANGTLDEERFSRFFRDYLMSKPDRGYVQPKATFPCFESEYAATGFSPKQLAKELTTSAKHYEIISGYEADESVPVTQALAVLNQLESSTTYPLLLALFARRVSGAIDAEQLADAIRMLCGFILRRFVCGESSRGYGRMFVRAVGKKGGDPFKMLEPYLLDRGWPDDRQFKAAFIMFPLADRGYSKEVLAALERARGHAEPADLSKAQVEHILPQTLTDAWRGALGPDAEQVHADWLHRPGNLTLSAYNQPAGNRPFPKKRAIYAKSNIVLTRELANLERWTEEQIRERGERLADEAAKIWIGPTEQVAVVNVGAGAGGDEAVPEDLSNAQKLQLEFWTEFTTRFNAQTKPAKPRKPSRQSWKTFGIGQSSFHLEAFISDRHRHVGVTLMIGGPSKAAYYHQLLAQKEEIEGELGETLTWYELPHKKSSYISLYLPNSDPNDRARWPEQHQWMIDRLEAFQRCFSGRVKSLAVDERAE